jgi:tetratricopeptide (TPR) repeat protein
MISRHKPYEVCYGTVVSMMLLASCATPDAQRIDNIPMYGQPAIQRPEALKKLDEDFINQATAGLGSREAASKAWAAQADKFMSQGNLDYAMRRYNQSWLLNPNNYQPYWGFGRVLFEQGKLDEGIEYFEKAKLLVDDPYQKVALLSDTGSAYSHKADSLPVDKREERARSFELANRQFTESTKLDSTYANSWLRWAHSLYMEGRYVNSWEKLKKARSLGAKETSVFLEALQEKMPEPK